MEVLTSISKLGIYAIFAVTIVGGLLAVTVRNIFHAALSLALTLVGIAATYFVLRADFLGAIQILLYVGGIMILIIFTVMLTSRIGDRDIPTSNRQRYPVAIGALLLILFLVRTIRKTPWQLSEELSTIDSAALGHALMGPYVFPFELIAVILVVILIGTVVIARSEPAP